MAALSFTGAGAPEVYVLRKEHRETMKKMKKQNAAETNGINAADDEKKISVGCFFRFSKKIHSAQVSYAERD